MTYTPDRLRLLAISMLALACTSASFTATMYALAPGGAPFILA